MLGLMQDFPLIIPKLLQFAEAGNADGEIVSRRLEGDDHRYTFADMGKRCAKLAHALKRLGVARGDRISTIAWNGYRHMELYYAVPGIESVYHTINPRLSAEQLSFVINHADDKYIFVEKMFVPLLENIKAEISNVKGFVVLCEADDMPDTTLPNVMSYEALIADEPESFAWSEFDENTACGLCYTSGTTGDPKGVLYSHRSIILQALSTSLALDVSNRETVLLVVPMFHVNGWTMPFVTALTGAKLVLPGKDLDGRSVWQLMDQEDVTFSAGVPTVWQMLIDYTRQEARGLPKLKRIVAGGSAVPRSMLETFQNDYDVEPLHAWGMTETTSMGTSPTVSPSIVARGDEAIMSARMSQGHMVFGAELKIVDDDGNLVPNDGKQPGNLCVRGWGVAKAYFENEASDAFLEDGWFDTGDIATIDDQGYMRITDRAKDLIKSGGEWISSIDLENAATGHEGVAAAAVISLPHPKWDERPLLIAVKAPGSDPDADDVLQYLSENVAKWWLPDAVVFVDELPLGATGKVNKLKLRERYPDFAAVEAENG